MHRRAPDPSDADASSRFENRWHSATYSRVRPHPRHRTGAPAGHGRSGSDAFRRSRAAASAAGIGAWLREPAPSGPDGPAPPGRDRRVALILGSPARKAATSSEYDVLRAGERVGDPDVDEQVGDAGLDERGQPVHARPEVERPVLRSAPSGSGASTASAAPSPPAASTAARIRGMLATGSAASSPHGIQPLPKRARRRATRSLHRPLTQIGTPPGWAGLGIEWMPVEARGRATRSSRAGSRHSVRQTSSDWSSRRPRARSRARPPRTPRAASRCRRRGRPDRGRGRRAWRAAWRARPAAAAPPAGCRCRAGPGPSGPRPR